MSAPFCNNQLNLRLAQTTNPLEENVDREALNDLLNMMRNNKENIGYVLRFMAHKIQSPHELEALKALEALELLVQRGDRKFIEEVGKNRFLNELIKLISPKYLGQRSTSKVKQKIIELLYLWSIEIKHEPKIFEAYQMLKRQLVLQDPIYVAPHIKPLSPPRPRPKDDIWDNEENANTLRRLIHSGNPQDLETANKLIKVLALQAERKTVSKSKCLDEIELARNNARLLEEVLANYNKNTSDQSELELINELFESCQRLRPTLFKNAVDIDAKDSLLDDITSVSDELSKVLIDCRSKVKNLPAYGADQGSSNNNNDSNNVQRVSNLLDVSPLQPPHSSSSLPNYSEETNDVSLLCENDESCKPNSAGDCQSNNSNNNGSSLLIDFLG